MKRPVLSLIFCISFLFSQAQYFEKKWDHTNGGDLDETLTTLIQTSDGGFLMGGYTQSFVSGEVTQPPRGGNDYWIVKLDSTGTKQWDQRFGGQDEEQLWDVFQTADSGYILGGWTRSDSGLDISEPARGSQDYWIVKTDGLGNKQWDKRFGGSDYDWLSAIQQTSDGGYIMGGYSASDSTGDVSQHSRGGEDFWVVKTDAAGVKVWDKRYGGNFTDALYDLQQTSDGGYIFGGRCVSDSSAEVSQQPRGNNDYWIVKTDNLGNRIWDRRFGGARNDNFFDLQQTNDDGYILGGYTVSDFGGDVTEVTRDTATLLENMGDIWIVKVDNAGVKEWDKRYGGNYVEDAFGYVSQMSDGNYLVGSASYSGRNGDKSEGSFGKEQSWILKLDSAGSKIWDKTLFVGGEDEYCYPIETSDGCIAVANWSQGDSAGYKSQPSRGNYDFWIIKLCETSVPQLPVADMRPSTPGICNGGCFDFYNFSDDSGDFHWEFPGANPDTSNVTNPTFICYSSPGNYIVRLIASNSSGSDTLESFISIYPLPTFSLTISQDTIYAPGGYSSYAWYHDSIVIVGAMDSFYVATQPGDYYVSVADSNFCPGAAAISVISVGIENLLTDKFRLFPNPVAGDLYISGIRNFIGGQLVIYDIAGRISFSQLISSDSYRISTDGLMQGIYFLEITNETEKQIAKFIKQ